MILDYKTSCRKVVFDPRSVQFKSLLAQFPAGTCIFCKSTLYKVFYSRITSVECSYCLWKLYLYNSTATTFYYKNHIFLFRYDRDITIALRNMSNSKTLGQAILSRRVSLQDLCNRANLLILQRQVLAK